MADPKYSRKGLFFLLALLAWFNCGIEEFRLGHLGEIPAHPLKLFVPPWLPLRAYVSQSGDEKLYWEYSKLVLGDAPDLDLLAQKRRGNFASTRVAIAREIRPGPGLRLPYRDFAFEYPPLPLALMVLPRLFVDSLPAYRLAYGILAALLTLLASGVGVLLGRELGVKGPPQPWLPLAQLVLAVGPLLVSRFDALPALLVASALFFLGREKPFRAGICAGAAVLSKLYPLLLLLPWAALLIGEGRLRQAWRMVAGAATAMLILAAPFFTIAPRAFLHSTFLYGARPFQVESIVGTLVMLLNGKAALIESFGSYNVFTPAWVQSIWAPLLPAGVLGCACLAWRQAYRNPGVSREERLDRLLRWTIAVIGVVLLTSKVLSPQFLIWLLPLAAVRAGTPTFRWAVVAAAITQIYFPFLYTFFVDEGSRLAALLVATRNLTLMALTAEALRSALCPTGTLSLARAPKLSSAWQN